MEVSRLKEIYQNDIEVDTHEIAHNLPLKGNPICKCRI